MFPLAMVSTRQVGYLWRLILFCVLLLPENACADTAAAQHKLGPWAEGLIVRPGMDASGRILRGCIFVGLDLRNARFDGADLAGCRIYQCDLRNASFRNAIFSGLQWGDCELEGAVLTGAVLNGAVPVHNLSGYGIQLTAEQLVSTRSYRTKNLSNCIVALALVNRKIVPHKLDFRNADLRGTIFSSCDLRECDFTGAAIDGMSMNGGTIRFEQLTATKNFSEGNLHGTGFGGVTSPDKWELSGLDLTGARFNGSGLLNKADLSDAIIRDCDLRCEIDQRQLSSTRSYREGDLSRLRLWYANLKGLDFSGMCLSGCHFRHCDFTGVALDDAVISSAQFSDCLITVDQIKSTWNFRHGRMDRIVLPTEIVAAIGEP